MWQFLCLMASLCTRAMAVFCVHEHVDIIFAYLLDIAMCISYLSADVTCVIYFPYCCSVLHGGVYKHHQ